MRCKKKKTTASTRCGGLPGAINKPFRKELQKQLEKAVKAVNLCRIQTLALLGYTFSIFFTDACVTRDEDGVARPASPEERADTALTLPRRANDLVRYCRIQLYPARNNNQTSGRCPAVDEGMRKFAEARTEAGTGGLGYLGKYTKVNALPTVAVLKGVFILPLDIVRVRKVKTSLAHLSPVRRILANHF